MKIAVSAVDNSPSSQMDPRFGRAPYYLIYDSEKKEYGSIANPGIQSAHGAGVQAAQLMLDNKIDVVISGRLGPNSHQILSASGIDIRACPPGTVEQAVELYQRGELPAISQAGPAHGGQGRGRTQ